MAETIEIIDGIETKSYASAKEAGAAFFSADPTMVIPNSLANDKDFREGFFGELEESIRKRLKNASIAITEASKLDDQLYANLERLSKVNFEKAAKIWEDHAPKDATAPAFVNRELRSEQSEPDMAEEKNVIEHVQEQELDVVDIKDAMNRAKQLRERDYEKLAAEQDRLGIKAEGKRIDIESLPEQKENQQFTESEKNRQAELMEQVHGQFRVVGAKFHFKDQSNKLAFKDKGGRMVSAVNDDRVAKAMATMAEAKGWKTIKVSGHPDFQREVWMEASMRGIEVRGYKPTEQDKKQLDETRERSMHNIVEQDTSTRERKTDSARENHPMSSEIDTNTSTGLENKPVEKSGISAEKTLRTHEGEVLEHGADNYNHDPDEKMNYFVKLATDKGEQTIWGVDLKRAMTDSGAQVGDDVKLEYKGNIPVTVEALKRNKEGAVIGKEEITTNRNTWDVQKSDKYKTVEAVAAAFIDKNVKDPIVREALKTAVDARLIERERAGKMPTVPIYDKSAPTHAQQPERTGPVVERNAERTR